MINNHSVLDVLTYMFDYLFESKNEVNDSELKAYLSEVGFDESGINKALIWLDNIAILADGQTQGINPSHHSIRIYTSDEQTKIDLKSRNFLYFLESIGQLDPTQREIIISQVMSLESNQLSLDDIKWIVIMVLGNYSKRPVSSEWLDAIISDSREFTLQ